MRKISRRTVLAAFASVLVTSRSSAAQDPLRIVYPYPAGGAGDAVCRIIAEQLQQRLARPVVVENKTGAGGRIGIQSVKDAAFESTLLFTPTGPMTFQPHLIANVGYDPFADFVPISEAARTEIALAVSTHVPVRSVTELVDWLRANPDQAVYGTPGVGTSAHFVGELLTRKSGAALRHTPYRGAPQAMTDILSGRMPIFIALSSELIEQHKAGGLRVLATAGATRSVFLPDVPTAMEVGLDVEAINGFAFYAPSRMQPELISRFEQEIVATVKLPIVQTKIIAMGLQPTGSTASELAQQQREQSERWGAAIKAIGYKVD